MKPNDILSLLLDESKRLGASAADVMFAQNVSMSLGQRMGKSEGVERAESKAIGLRVFFGQKIASVSASDLNPASLKALVERACDMAKVSPEDPYSLLAPENLLSTLPPALDLCDPSEPSTDWMIEQSKTLEESALAVKGITNSNGSSVGHSRSSIALATSNGFRGEYSTSSTSISVSVVAGTGEDKQEDYDYATCRYASDLPSAASIGSKAGALAVEKMHPRKMATCQVPVVFEPRAGNRLLYYFSGAINGASIARGTSFLKDAMGSAVFSNGISIIDDPHRVRGLSSRPFDGEGVKNSKRALVENGILKSWLLDTRSAKKLNLATTGHASRGLGSPPSPSPTNMYMEKGNITPDALIKDIKNGFYITETFGMGVNLVTGDYSQGASGFWIENGEIAFAVSELTIAGKLQDMYKHITAANDLEFRYSSNTPTYRIDGMTIAGT